MKFEWRRLLPQYWYQQSETDWEWDRVLNNLLDNHTYVKLGHFVLELDKAEVWIENYPYSFGSLYSFRAITGVPSVKTRIRLKKFIEGIVQKKYEETRQAYLERLKS